MSALRDHIADQLRARFYNELAERIETIVENEREEWESKRREEIEEALEEQFENELEDSIDYEIQKRRQRAEDELMALATDDVSKDDA
jgi:hypothetical protein